MNKSFIKRNNIYSNIKSLAFLCLFIITLCLTYSKFGRTAVNAEFYDRNVGSSEIVIEQLSGRILYENNAYEKKYMASTTKILTAICVIENCDVEKTVKVKKETVGIEGSSIYLKEGEELTVKELLYGLMLRSGNDCAETLAVECSGSIKDFASLMNETAKKAGACNSNFVNPHGLHDDNHYTTAYDLAMISRYAMNNELFKEIVSTKRIGISNSLGDYKRILINKNKMLKEFDGANGIKTGFTKKAGRCLVSSAKRNGMELICVVLNCPPMFEKSKNLLDTAFNRYSLIKVLNSEEILDFIPVKGLTEQIGICVKNDVYVPMTESERENYRVINDYPSELQLPINKNKELGFINILYKNNLLFREKVYSIIDV